MNLVIERDNFYYELNKQVIGFPNNHEISRNSRHQPFGLIEFLNGISSPQILGCTYVIGTPSEVCVSIHHPKQKVTQMNGLLAMAEMPSKKSGASKGGNGSPEVFSPSKWSYADFVSVDGNDDSLA
jgi:hypothetical protein